MSSSTISTGPAAAASRTAAVRSSNTWRVSRLLGASGSNRVSIRRADGLVWRSSSPASSALTASTTGANEIPASMSRQCPVATVNPSSAARRSRSATSVVLPIPASPHTSTICGVPCAASPSTSSSSAVSRSRPSSRGSVRLGTGKESTALGVDGAKVPRSAMLGAPERVGDRCGDCWRDRDEAALTEESRALNSMTVRSSHRRRPRRCEVARERRESAPEMHSHATVGTRAHADERS